jgi:hypothetical protein
MRTYEAAISRPDNLARIQAARRSVERIGGKIAMSPPNAAGMVLVVVTLPEPYTPDDFFPGVPFSEA